MVSVVLLRRNIIFDPVKHLKEIITWRHMHAIIVLVHLLSLQLTISWLNCTFGPISFEQFEIGPKVESNQKVCYFGGSQWSKTGTTCICRHVITSFKCFSGPKMKPSSKFIIIPIRVRDPRIARSRPIRIGPRLSKFCWSGLDKVLIRGSLIRIVQQSMYRWF